jgi:hypothetical protein
MTKKSLILNSGSRKVRNRKNYSILRLLLQEVISALTGQLEDIKCINLEMYTKLAVCTF